MPKPLVVFIGVLAVFVGAVLVTLTCLDVVGAVDVHTDVIVTLTGLLAAFSITHVVARVGNQIADRMGCEHGEMRAFVHDEHAEMREALAGFGRGLDDYVDHKVVEDRIATLRELAPSNGHGGVRLRDVSQ